MAAVYWRRNQGGEWEAYCPWQCLRKSKTSGKKGFTRIGIARKEAWVWYIDLEIGYVGHSKPFDSHLQKSEKYGAYNYRGHGSWVIRLRPSRVLRYTEPLSVTCANCDNVLQISPPEPQV